MVVGNGLVARAFSEFASDSTVLLFCSGVSDSTCKDAAAFERERNLICDTIRQYPEYRFVYFSTCSIEDPSMQDSLYVQHKREMEGLVVRLCRQYHIFRLSNAVGSTGNPATILNFLYHNIKSGTAFALWTNSSRNLIDMADAARIVTAVLKRNLYPESTINIANQYSYPVMDIVAAIEQYLGHKGQYTLVEKGIAYSISIAPVAELVKELGIDFEGNYMARLLAKYYTV